MLIRVQSQLQVCVGVQLSLVMVMGYPLDLAGPILLHLVARGNRQYVANYGCILGFKSVCCLSKIEIVLLL